MRVFQGHNKVGTFTVKIRANSNSNSRVVRKFVVNNDLKTAFYSAGEYLDNKYSTYCKRWIDVEDHKGHPVTHWQISP